MATEWQAYLFISPAVRKEDFAGAGRHVRERIQDVRQLTWVNVCRLCDGSATTEAASTWHVRKFAP